MIKKGFGFLSFAFIIMVFLAIGVFASDECLHKNSSFTEGDSDFCYYWFCEDCQMGGAATHDMGVWQLLNEEKHVAKCNNLNCSYCVYGEHHFLYDFTSEYHLASCVICKFELREKHTLEGRYDCPFCGSEDLIIPEETTEMFIESSIPHDEEMKDVDGLKTTKGMMKRFLGLIFGLGCLVSFWCLTLKKGNKKK